MTATLTRDLPQPWPGRLWCAICAGQFKAALADPSIPLPRLEQAVTRTVYPPLACLGPLDVCWAHAAPLTTTGDGGCRGPFLEPAAQPDLRPL